MSTLIQTRPTPRRGRREPVSAASIARFIGLSAAARRARRSALFRTRERTVSTLSLTVALASAVGMVLLLIPGSRAPLAAALRAPGGWLQSIRGGAASDDLVKGYPRLYSPHLGIDVAIRPGDGNAPPVRPIAYQYPGTAPLGQVGNTYLYAHDRPGMFAGLHNARIGDVVVVELSATQRVYYQVTEIHTQVAWNDFEWLRPSADNRLTLQTCDFSGDYDPRFVVVTRLVPAALGARLAGP